MKTPLPRLLNEQLLNLKRMCNEPSAEHTTGHAIGNDIITTSLDVFMMFGCAYKPRTSKKEQTIRT
jgi:hypothetical protein